MPRLPRLALAAMAFALIPACASAAPPTSSSPRDVVAAKFEAVNRHDLAGIAALYAPGAVITASDFCAPRGADDIERTYTGIFSALTDVRADVQEYIAEGDRVAVRYVVRGAFNGHPVAIPILNFFTVDNGLITRDDGVFDNGGRACQA